MYVVAVLMSKFREHHAGTGAFSERDDDSVKTGYVLGEPRCNSEDECLRDYTKAQER
jgi:hypothetical protein